MISPVDAASGILSETLPLQQFPVPRSRQKLAMGAALAIRARVGLPCIRLQGGEVLVGWFVSLPCFLPGLYCCFRVGNRNGHSQISTWTISRVTPTARMLGGWCRQSHISQSVQFAVARIVIDGQLCWYCLGCRQA